MRSVFSHATFKWTWIVWLFQLTIQSFKSHLYKRVSSICKTHSYILNEILFLSSYLKVSRVIFYCFGSYLRSFLKWWISLHLSFDSSLKVVCSTPFSWFIFTFIYLLILVFPLNFNANWIDFSMDTMLSPLLIKKSWSWLRSFQHSKVYINVFTLNLRQTWMGIRKEKKRI